MITSTEVMKEVASIFNLSPDYFLIKCRLDEYTYPKKVYMYICNNYLSLSKAEISRKLRREKTYTGKELKIIQRHIDNKEHKWLLYWSKYERESVLLKQLINKQAA